MNKKELLTEENYENGKKKLIKLSLIILVCGLLIGSVLIAIGAVKTNNAQKELEKNKIQIQEQEKEETNETEENETATQEEDLEEKKSELNKNILDIKAQINTLNSELQMLQQEKNSIFMEDKGFSDRYYAKQQEITTKENEKDGLNQTLQEYEYELSRIKTKEIVSDTKEEYENNISNNTNSSDGAEMIEGIFAAAQETILTAKYKIYYVIGIFVIIGSAIVSLALYLFARKRDISVFTIQQSMPVAQEAIDKMAPTVGNAVGTIGKDIAQGITEGIKEGKKDE